MYGFQLKNKNKHPHKVSNDFEPSFENYILNKNRNVLAT